VASTPTEEPNIKKTLLITIATVALVTLAAAALLFTLGAIGGSVDDPASAACTRPPTTVGPPHVVLDHREASVHFTCSGARLSGTLFSPLARGPHPAVVWLHGSGAQARLAYGPLVASFVRDGLAFFSYDKRGVGDSEGTCCPDETGHFNLVTADAVGAVAALRSAPAVDAAQVGFVGASAAGWIAPRATEESGHVAFVALASPGVLRHSIVARFEQFAGGSESSSPRPSEDAISKEVASWKPSGFDPTAYLAKLDVPALWLFGGADRNVPPVQSVALLRSIARERGKDWTIVVFPGAGHGLFDEPSTDPQAGPTAEAWVRRHVEIHSPGRG
jgi:alpha-beta hydrolase superfamily lysophospholipase